MLVELCEKSRCLDVDEESGVEDAHRSDPLRREPVREPRGVIGRPVDIAFVDAHDLVQHHLRLRTRAEPAHRLMSFQDAYTRAHAVGDQLPGVEVAYQVAGGERQNEEELGQFDSGAATQLVLFMFVNSLADSAALIQTRQYGVLRRMLATPTRAASVLLGETLGRFLVAMVQGLFIVAVAGLIFGVDWGDPLGVAASLCCSRLSVRGQQCCSARSCPTSSRQAHSSRLVSLSPRSADAWSRSKCSPTR